MTRATPELPFEDEDPGACFVGVALDVPLDKLFTYRVPSSLADRAWPGHRASVPFRNRRRIGVIVERQSPPDLARILDVADIPDAEPLFGPDLLDLGAFIARYYGTSLGEALRALVPRGVRTRGRGAARTRVRLSPTADGAEVAALVGERPPGPRGRILRLLSRHPEGFVVADLLRRAHASRSPIDTLVKAGLIVKEKERAHADDLQAAIEESPGSAAEPPVPTPQQAEALERVDQAVRGGAFAPFLLLGVTGSGKTEVYLRAINTCVGQGRQAIVLVPEIALTPQTVRRFRARFERVAVLHSALTDAERARTWRAIRAGTIDVVIGPRSAVFAPVPRLGLIVVDEEHEGSFKQQNAPRYHARDVGMVRAQAAGAGVILGSATPSLETWRNAQEGRYGLLRLPERVGGRPLPSVQIVDVSSGEERLGAGRHLSRTLGIRIREALSGGGQVILLQNRRGFATSVACPRCGWVFSCTYCDVGLTYHRTDALGLCHLCGHEAAVPRVCPDCALPVLRMRGVGTQTVESQILEVFPEARVARMDSDTMATREAYEEVLGRFGRRELDVLVGTQMIGKGLHFPHVTLVGIVSADTALALPDFRSAERTFSLVAQVAGRAGRGEAPGRVVVQTTHPDHPAIRCAAEHDYERFAAIEMADRRRYGYPPWSRLLRVVVRAPDPDAADQRIAQTAERLQSAADDDVLLLGPATPGVARVQGLHRRHLLAKTPGPSRVARLLRCLRAAPRPPRGIEEIWDVDPYSVL